MEELKRQLRKAQRSLAHFWQRVRAGSKLDIAILVCAALLALVLLAILIFSLAGRRSPAAASGETLQQMIDSAPSAVSAVESGYDKTQGELNQSQYADTILPETEDAGQSYMDSTLFVGDSNTARMVAFGETSWQNNLGVVSMGIQHVLSSNCVNLQGYGYVDVPTAIRLLQPQRIIICFGTNNAYSDTETFIGWYRQALEMILEEWPYADLIIAAVPPVAATRSYPDITMSTIDSFNRALVELAQEMGLKFLNTSEVLKDEDGYAVDGYMERDGIHLAQEGMDVLTDYIRTHAYETEDRRPQPLDDIPTHYETPESFFNPPAPSSSSSASSSESTACAHNWVEYARLDPTCTEQGAVAYRCSLCGQETSEILPALGHTWGTTDQNTGLRTCTVCGVSETDPSWTAHTHTWGATDPSTGLRTCTGCGVTEADPSWTAPHTHTWGATDPSTGLRTCTGCGATETDPSWTPPASIPTPPASMVTPPADTGTAPVIPSVSGSVATPPAAEGTAPASDAAPPASAAAPAA